MTNILFPNDYKFGVIQEEIILPIIQSFFGKNINKSLDKYSKFDFFDDDCYYELKSRTNCYSKYPTTIITADKINADKKTIFIFNFTDGIFYIEYNKEQFDTYEQRLFSRASISWNEKLHFYIPISDLKPIFLSPLIID